MAKPKLPPFGELPGFDVELFHDALRTNDRDAALDEFFILIEEGHSPQFLGRLILESILELGKFRQIPALNAAMSHLPHLPSEYTGLALLQVVSLFFVKERDASPEEKTSVESNRQVVVMGILRATEQHFGSMYRLELLDLANAQVADESQAKNGIQSPLDSPITEDIGNKFVQSINELLEIAALSEDSTQVDWISDCILNYHTAFTFTHTFDTVAFENLKRELTSIPKMAELPMTLKQEQYSLLDFAVLIETGKQIPALRFLHSWLDAGGSKEPVWGILSRCAIRADADLQNGMGIRAVSGLLQIDRDYNPGKSPNPVYAATSILAQLPHQYKLYKRFYLDEM